VGVEVAVLVLLEVAVQVEVVVEVEVEVVESRLHRNMLLSIFPQIQMNLFRRSECQKVTMIQTVMEEGVVHLRRRHHHLTRARKNTYHDHPQSRLLLSRPMPNAEIQKHKMLI